MDGSCVCQSNWEWVAVLSWMQCVRFGLVFLAGDNIYSDETG